jgi:chromosome segregation ATPase
MRPTVIAERPVGQVRRSKLLLRELILENLMTYKYARIPISPGLNLVLGPNGAGKSSILLGLSVGLGQAHTERGRKLSDLIRWGEDIARITLVFDNRAQNGSRPIPEVRTDELVITRYLREDGEYWHQMNFRQATRLEIYDVLNRFGIDPDNMFIIMHQYMVEEIAALTPQTMLQTMEKAVGLTHFRDRIREAREKLTEVASEEKQLSSLLSEAQATLDTWHGEVEKLRKRDSLKLRMTELQIEQAWSEHASLSQELERLTEKNARINERLGKYNSRIEEATKRVADLQAKLRNEIETSVASTTQVGESERAGLKQELTRTVESYAEARVKEAILKRNLSLLTRLGYRVEASVRSAQNICEEAFKKASELGPKPGRTRNREEIVKELEGTQIGLATLGSVVENAEQIYESYKKTYDDIEQKSLSVKKNKESVLGEIDETLTLWRREVAKLVDQLSDSFKEKMRGIGADGEVRFTGQEDMDQAGIQIMVSFGGSRLVELNSFTQSGGERSSSIIAFMLSLQSLIQSPLRALDEFDIHMDPRNRETFFKLVEQEANSNPEASYLVVTPGQVPKTITKAVGIVVQKVSGASVINIVENV